METTNTIPPVPLNRELIRSVIEKDQLIYGHLVESHLEWSEAVEDNVPVVCESAGHCAVGALLHNAGFTNAELARMSSYPTSFEDATLEKLYRTYGINLEGLIALVQSNDRVIHDPFSSDSEEQELAERRASVLSAVDALQGGLFQTPPPVMDDWDDEDWDDEYDEDDDWYDGDEQEDLL